jgi:uncharacterized protein YciI
MLYAIIGHAANPTAALARRAEVRPAHLARVEALQAAGRLIIAGPFPAIDSPEPGPAGYAGLLIIAEFRSLSAAQAWAADDPYVTEGVVDQVEVKPYIRVLP